MSIEQCDFEIRHIPAVPQRQRQRTVVVSITMSMTMMTASVECYHCRIDILMV